jgi:diguanylate cyclase (GGDEF)-like protein
VLEARPHILIADDSATNRTVMRRILEEFPADVVETRSGAEALSEMEKQEFALALLDVQMPEVDGFETVRRMRRMPKSQATPVIFVTAAFTDESHQRLGYDLGAVDYMINKPINPEILRQKVRVFLDLYQKRVELQQVLSRVQEENEKLYYENEQFKAARTVLEKRATHDPLTGLPNRALLEDRINIAIQRARRGGKSFAIAYVDLDDFKEINDRYGHAAGDKVLTEVAQRLVQSVRASDTVARLGGDEFVVLMEGLDSEARAPILGRKILDSIMQPVSLLSTAATSVELKPTASIGLALFPADADDGEGLMVLADLAMYEAKRQGGGNVRVYREVARRRSQTI